MLTVQPVTFLNHGSNLKTLTSLAEEPNVSVLDPIDPSSRDIIERLQALARFAAEKHREARALARELDQVHCAITDEINRVLAATRAAADLATKIAHGTLAVCDEQQLPESFGMAVHHLSARDLLRVPPRALVELDTTRLVGTTPNSPESIAA